MTANADNTKTLSLLSMLGVLVILVGQGAQNLAFREDIKSLESRLSEQTPKPVASAVQIDRHPKIVCVRFAASWCDYVSDSTSGWDEEFPELRSHNYSIAIRNTYWTDRHNEQEIRFLGKGVGLWYWMKGPDSKELDLPWTSGVD